MKIFWIGPYLPSPEGSGGDIRSFHLMRELKRRGATLRGWFQGTHDDRARGFFDNLTVKSLSGPLRYGRALWGRMGGTPFSYGRYYDPMIEQVVPDGFIPYVDHLHMSVNFSRESNHDFWLDEHNVEYVLWNEFSNHCSVFKRWFIEREAPLVKQFEFDRIYESAGTGLPSKENLERLPEECRSKVSIIPNGVSEEWLEYGRRNLQNTVDKVERFGYIGSYDWPPNYEAIDDFLKNHWPKYHDTHPQAELYIAGPSPDSSWQTVAGVTVMGFVDTSREFFDMIDTLVVPLAIGSGTRLKILEAVARGIPVLSTEKGIEGLNLPAIRTVDERGKLVSEMEKMESSTASVSSGREANFQYVEDQYKWTSIGKSLWNTLSDLF